MTIRRLPRALPWLLLACLLLAACAVGGGSGPRPAFRYEPPAAAEDPFPNWPRPPITSHEELVAFDRDRAEELTLRYAGAGVTGALRAEAHFPSLDRPLEVKVKPVPGALDGWNNSPRKELAAEAVQRLFLDPEDFVVPTVTMRCISLEKWTRHAEPRPATIPGTRCVLTQVAFWLQDVTVARTLLDRERFRSEPRYAYHLANFNLLTYLIDHRDTRRANILVSKDEANRHVFSIDNGISFGTRLFNYLAPVTYEWRRIRVSALPERSLERLRALRREDLDALAVISQLEDDGTGMLHLVRPGAPLDPGRGFAREGTTVQFGLSEGEIDDLWRRIEKLLEAVDDDRIGVF